MSCHTRAARICRPRTPDNQPRPRFGNFPATAASPEARQTRVNRAAPGLADLCRPHGVDGTSSSEDSRQRPGDGESPGVLSGAKITPSRRKSARPTRGRQVDPAAVDEEWAAQQHPGRQGGWYRGSGRCTAPTSSSLQPRSTQAEATHRRTSRERVPPRPTPGGPPRPRARGARALARPPDLRQVAGPRRRPSALDVLRGPADRERPPGHPPRRGARLQGRLPAVQDDAGLPRRAEGRLGLPRAARRARGGEGARLHRQGATSRSTASRSSTRSAGSPCCGTSTPSRR